MGKIAAWYRRRQQRGNRPLAPIELAIGGMLALALAIAAAITIIGLNLLHFQGFKPEPLLSAGTLYDLLKVAFAFAAGIGGVIALVTAYRRQRVAELAQDLAQQQHQLASQAEERAARDSEQERELARTRLFNERFTTAAGQLGDDRPAVRLAGIYAMAGLADDWPAQRQTCVYVLCAYIRMPYEPDPGDQAPAEARQAFRALQEVRHTVIRVITAHMQPDDRRAATAQDWRGLDLDFEGAIFDGGRFDGAEFSGGIVSFFDVQFSGGLVSFNRAEFSGGLVSFNRGAQFSGGKVYFNIARFTGGEVSFDRAWFTGGEIAFGSAQFTGGEISFNRAKFTGGTVSFLGAKFTGGEITFNDAQFSGGEISFGRAGFTGGVVSFVAQFSGGTVSSEDAWFSGSKVYFNLASSPGARSALLRSEAGKSLHVSRRGHPRRLGLLRLRDPRAADPALMALRPGRSSTPG
jgi:hypothetical protein